MNKLWMNKCCFIKLKKKDGTVELYTGCGEKIKTYRDFFVKEVSMNNWKCPYCKNDFTTIEFLENE